MKSRPHDPRRLDLAAAAREGATLEGRWPLAGFGRLLEPGLVSDADVAWSARVEARPVAGGEPEIWLHLRAEAVVLRECQRCLQPVALPLRVDRRFLFVDGEEQAAALDADAEEDVLALPRSLDLHELVEDELLLALPLVPRHEACPQPLPMTVPSGEGAEDDAQAPAHPFAALAALKAGKPGPRH